MFQRCSFCSVTIYNTKWRCCHGLLFDIYRLICYPLSEQVYSRAINKLINCLININESIRIHHGPNLVVINHNKSIKNHQIKLGTESGLMARLGGPWEQLETCLQALRRPSEYLPRSKTYANPAMIRYNFAFYKMITIWSIKGRMI